MGHEELSGILDIRFEKHLEVVQQTCNHSLQLFPSDQSLFGCHKALLLPQVLPVLCTVKLPSAELILAPVNVLLLAD